MNYSSQFYKKCVSKASLLIICMMLLTCVENKKESRQTNNEEQLKREVTIAKEFETLVIVDSLGITGADGVISFPLTDGASVFMMGDSFLKPVINGKRDPESIMINNTFIIVDEKNNTSKSIYKGDLNNPETLLVPNNDNGKDEYYWPGHGFEHNGELHIFMSRFMHVPDDGWGFKYSGTDYLTLEKDTYKIISQQDFPFSIENGVHYGHSIIKEDHYTYIYGTWHDKDYAVLHVARGEMDATTNKLTNFEFFNGESWVKDPKQTKALTGINKQTPEQFTVFKRNDTYVLVMQERGLDTGNIYSYISNSPTGPWTNEKHLYHATEQENREDELFTYNAMAHPQFIQDNKLLISYCVNSFVVPKIHENVSYYRPRFIWVPLEHILE